MNNDLFNHSLASLKTKKLFLLDQDGTLYLGDHLFPFTLPFLNALKSAEIKYMFITNNSSRSVADYVNKLASLGIDAASEDFYTSTEATILYLKTHYPRKSVFAVGTTSFAVALAKAGIELKTWDQADVAVLAYDRELTYQKLIDLSQMLTKRDVPYLATNPDWVCPTAFGFVPDCGSFAWMIEQATGKLPLFIGKPSPLMINTIIEKLGYTVADVVVVGDRLYTDIASANNAGVDSIAVLSGEATLEEIKNSPHQPTFVVNSVGELIPALK